MGGLPPDLAGPRPAARRRSRPRARHDGSGSGGRTCTSTPCASDGTAGVARDPRPRRAARRASTSSRSPTTSGSTPRSPAGRSRSIAACPSRSSSARRSRRAAATCSRSGSSEPIRPFRSLRATIAEIHDQGGLAIPAHPLVPYPLCAQGFVLRRLPRRRDPRYRPDALEAFNPTTLGRPASARACASPEHGLARVGNCDAHALDAIGPGSTTFPGRDGADAARGDRRPARPTTAPSTRPAPSSATFREQLRKYGRDAAQRTSAAGIRRRRRRGATIGYSRDRGGSRATARRSLAERRARDSGRTA